MWDLSDVDPRECAMVQCADCRRLGRVTRRERHRDELGAWTTSEHTGPGCRVDKRGVDPTRWHRCADFRAKHDHHTSEDSHARRPAAR